MPSRYEAADMIVRLYHRRQGWAWVGFGSDIGTSRPHDSDS